MFENINKNYLDKEIKLEMEEFFEKENFIQLNDFFNCDLNLIKSNIKSKKFIEKYNPLKYKFSQLDTKNIYDFEIIKIIEFFKSKKFIEFIEEITDLDLNLLGLKINKYKQTDFTLLHDDQEKEDVIEIIYDLDENWKEEFGGILTYTTKDEEVFYLSPIFNSLTILYKSNSIMKYLKYINNLAKKKSIIRFEIKFAIED